LSSTKVILQHYFNTNLEFRGGVLTCAWITFGCLILANTILLTLSAGQETTKSQESVPISPPPNTLNDPEKASSLVARISGYSITSKPTSHGTSALLLAVTGCFFASATCYWPIFYISLFGESYGISSSNASYAVSALNIASIVGRTVPCWIADITGVFWVIVPSVALAGESKLV
jgi:hypothetical protein